MCEDRLPHFPLGGRTSSMISMCRFSLIPVMICSPLSPRVVVGAPQEIKAPNQTGGLYQCDYSMATCEPIHLQGELSHCPSQTQG